MLARVREGRNLTKFVPLNSQLYIYESPEHHPQSNQAENKAVWIYSGAYVSIRFLYAEHFQFSVILKL